MFSLMEPGSEAMFSLMEPPDFQGHGATTAFDPQEYLDEVMRVLPYSPKYWQPTRSNLNPVELEADLCSFTIAPAALNFAR